PRKAIGNGITLLLLNRTFVFEETWDKALIASRGSSPTITSASPMPIMEVLACPMTNVEETAPPR
ncbi:MAG: hypothetical protein P8X50_16230, partial [Maritimibacter sp.]